jgi:hypothetical protein
MKKLHRKDLFGWSEFNERLDLDFNSFAWIHEGGNVVIDPLPMSAHDLEHLKKLGGAQWIVITNSFHVRGTSELQQRLGAKIAGPAAEEVTFPLRCDRWLRAGDEVVPGLQVLQMDGSKTPGELALLLEGTTLITGDLVRSHRGGALDLLAVEKLADPRRAMASVEKLLDHTHIEAVLVGDGFCVFRDGHARLADLAASLRSPAAR